MGKCPDQFPQSIPLTLFYTHCQLWPTSSAAVQLPIDDSQSLLAIVLWNKVTTIAGSSTGLISTANIQLFSLKLFLVCWEKHSTLITHKLGISVDFHVWSNHPCRYLHYIFAVSFFSVSRLHSIPSEMNALHMFSISYNHNPHSQPSLTHVFTGQSVCG